MIDELREEHRGICQTKALASSCIWSPGMDADVENMVEKCAVRHSVKN